MARFALGCAAAELVGMADSSIRWVRRRFRCQASVNKAICNPASYEVLHVLLRGFDIPR